MNLNTTIARAEGLFAAPVDEDLVILSQNSNNYLGLDEIGRRIWDLLETPRRVDELCRQLAGEYSGSPEQITADVLPFLDELVSEGIVHAVEA